MVDLDYQYILGEDPKWNALETKSRRICCSIRALYTSLVGTIRKSPTQEISSRASKQMHTRRLTGSARNDGEYSPLYRIFGHE